MADRVFRRLITWPAVGLLLVLFLLCQQGFGKRADALGCGHETLDVQGWYTPEKAHELLREMGPDGRHLYAVTELTLDLVFPAVYSGLFAGLIGNLFPPRAARRLALVPVVGALADWSENGLAAYLAWTFDPLRVDPVARVAAVATLVKTVLFVASGLAIVVGAVLSIRRGPRP